MSKTRFFQNVVLAAAVTLAGSTALAAARGAVNFRVNGTTMVAGPAIRTPVQRAKEEPGLVAIFDNMLPVKKYPYGTYFCCYAPGIVGPDNQWGIPEQWFAEAFTPSVNATVTKIELGVTYIAGTNSVNVGLYSDAGGLPGTSLVSRDLDNLPTFGGCCATITLKDSQGVAVTAGTQYWVVVSTDSKDEDFLGSWNYNTSDQVTKINQAENFGSGWQLDTVAPGVALAVWGQ